MSESDREEIFLRLPARLRLPDNDIMIPQVREYVDDLHITLLRMYQDLITAIKAAAKTVIVNPGEGNALQTTWLFRSPNGHWWQLHFDDTGNAVTDDLGSELPEEYK